MSMESLMANILFAPGDLELWFQEAKYLDLKS